MGTVEEFVSRLPGGADLLSSIGTIVDATPLRRIHLQDLRVEDVFSGTEINLALLVDGTIELKVPGFPALSITIGATDDAYTAIRGVVTVGETSDLTFPDIRATLRLDTPLLRTVDPPGPLEVTVQGSFSMDRGVNIRASLAGFSLPQVMIGNTGLLVSASQCVLDLADDTTPDAITALGFGPEFRGIHAATATLMWLPQTVFNGLPGLRLDLVDLAIGTEGVSFDIAQTFTLDDDGRHILPTSERAGHLFDTGFELGLREVTGQVRTNVPTAFGVSGLLRVPFLDALFAVEFGVRPEEEGHAIAVSLTQSSSTIDLDLGAGSLTVERLHIDGVVDETGFTVTGSVSGALSLDPLDVLIDRAQVSLRHDADHDSLEIELNGLDLGPLGEVESAKLRIISRVDDADVRTNSVVIEGTYRWADLVQRFDLTTLPAQFPLPPDDGLITAFLSWEDDGNGGFEIVVRFDASVEHPDSLWQFIPSDFRPEVHTLVFTAEVRYAHAAAFAGEPSGSEFKAELSAKVTVRLPALPHLAVNLVTVHTGGDDGLVEGTIRAGIDQAGTGYLRVTVSDPVAIDFDLPGMPQPEPFLHAEITSIDFDLAAGSVAEGGFTMLGTFSVRPINPPLPAPLTSHLQGLFESVDVGDLTGTTELSLRFRDDRAAVVLDCTFSAGAIDVNVFEMLGGVAGALGVPPDADPPRGAAALDIAVGVGLRGLRFQLGSLVAGGAGETASLELRADLRLADLAVPLLLRLSNLELALGLDAIDIPLRPPRFPLSPSDLAGLTTDAAWQSRIDGLASAAVSQPMTSAGAAEATRIAAQLTLLQALFAIRQAMEPGSRGGFEDGAGVVIGVLDAASGVMTPASDISLALRAIRIVIPFADPRDVRVEGGASLTGFAADDPLKALEGLQLGLGISADTIFFSLQTISSLIQIPDLGR
ncbi:hypothetical protein [Nakamurella multipartita]|uniref:hypothetical protein n=1 Tax=Nakamurella multipartita TaxID=53461 RepID=UPI0010FF58F6|nr:hypothetical protein [Nakamurella multipartita]